MYECVREIPTEEDPVGHHFRAAHTMEDRGPGFYSRKYGICVHVCVHIHACVCHLHVCVSIYVFIHVYGHLHRTIHACSFSKYSP